MRYTNLPTRLSYAIPETNITANSYTDVTWNRTDNRTFLAATFNLSGSSKISPFFLNIDQSKIVLRIINNYTSAVTVSGYIYMLVNK